MPFKTLHWLSYHGIWVIIPCSTNMVVHVSIWLILFAGGGGHFLFYFSFLYLEVFLTKQLPSIPLTHKF